MNNLSPHTTSFFQHNAHFEVYGLVIWNLELTNCLQPLYLPGGFEVVPSEEEKHCHDKEGWDEHPIVGSSCRQYDGQEPKEKLWET